MHLELRFLPAHPPRRQEAWNTLTPTLTRHLQQNRFRARPPRGSAPFGACPRASGS